MEYGSLHTLELLLGVNKSFVPPWSPNEDPRSLHLPLMGSPELFVSLVVLYVLIVVLGQRWMKGRKAWDVRRAMQVYNVFLTLLSLYMAVELPLSGFGRGLRFSCDYLRSSMETEDFRVAQVIWLYFFSKIIEYADTIFMVVRKKNEQISFLHVYHHVSVSLIWYVVAKHYPGGSAVYLPMVNCIVHVFMYAYYFLASLGDWIKPYLWWKRYITQLQMVQFVFLSGHACLVFYLDCGFPQRFAAFVASYMISLYLLFLAFYRKTYRPKEKKNAEGVEPSGRRFKHTQLKID